MLSRTRITIQILDGICLTRIYEIHRYILQFSEMKIWNFHYLRKSPNESYQPKYFWTSVEKKCVPQILTSDNCSFLRSFEWHSIFVKFEKMSLLWKLSKSTHHQCCCSLSLKQMEIHSMTMELEFSNLDFVEISSYEYDAYISWNMAEYIKWYQTKIWADRATLGLSNGIFGFLVRRLVHSKSLSES